MVQILTSHTKRSSQETIVKRGRLEIATGGWTMTDEASVNLYSMIDQLVEGHQWVMTHLGVVPKTSWNVDPFVCLILIFEKGGSRICQVVLGGKILVWLYFDRGMDQPFRTF